MPNAYWQTSSNKFSEILDNSAIPFPTPTHSGSWKAWLGGDNVVQESVWQTITVPANAWSLQVKFWWRITTSESLPFINDWLDVQITDANGVVLETLYTLYDGDVNSEWVELVLPVSSAYAGQTIRIVFSATTDGSDETSFFVDDVTVVACY